MGEMSADDMAHPFTEISLSKGWSFQQTDKTEDGWLPVKSVPSTVHQDLIDNKQSVINSRGKIEMLTLSQARRPLHWLQRDQSRMGGD